MSKHYNNQAKGQEGVDVVDWTVNQETLWLAVGFIGQVIFGMRFVVQWLYSEYKKKSVIPHVFWYLSIVGSLVLLAYAVYRKDPVFVLGFSLNLLIYVRNLWLIFRPSQP